MLVQELIPATQTNSRGLQQNLFSLLQNSNTIKKISQIHTQIIINGFTQKRFIIVKLLSWYTSLGCLHHADRVFKRLETPSTTVWNQIIRGHANSQTPHKSIEIFNEMQASEALPDGYTYSFVISACARGKLLREGEQLHGRVFSTGLSSNLFVKTNLVNLYSSAGLNGGSVKNANKVLDEMGERNVVTWNSLLAGSVRCQNFDEAHRIFDEMPERNVVSWTIMIAGFAQNGRCMQALSWFRQMRRANLALDQIILVSALSACAEIGDLHMGKWIHSYIDEVLCVGYNARLTSLNNALIHMYASCGEIDEAHKLFEWMPRRTTASWSTMITGFAKQGRGKEALSTFQWMQIIGKNEAKPDGVTLIGVLSACSHAGFINEGRYYFSCMTQLWGIVPTIEHYGCMVDLLSRAGFLNEAQKRVEAMPMNPNDAIWGAILGGCRIHKNVELASCIAQKLAVDLEPDRAVGYLVLLSNVYASANRWKDVLNIRRKMVGMGMKKPPGRSWVQIDDTVHDFLAGDQTHKDASLIYEMLVLITKEAMLAGYEPDIFEAQLDGWSVTGNCFYSLLWFDKCTLVGDCLEFLMINEKEMQTVST